MPFSGDALITDNGATVTNIAIVRDANVFNDFVIVHRGRSSYTFFDQNGLTVANTEDVVFLDLNAIPPTTMPLKGRVVTILHTEEEPIPNSPTGEKRRRRFRPRELQILNDSVKSVFVAFEQDLSDTTAPFTFFLADKILANENVTYTERWAGQRVSIPERIVIAAAAADLPVSLRIKAF